MKNKLFILMLAALICSGCNSAAAATEAPAAETTTASETSTTTEAAASFVTTTSAETMAASLETTTEEQTTEAFVTVEPEEGKTLIDYNTWIEYAGKMPFYLEDAEFSGDEQNGTYSFDYIYGYPATGFFDDSDTHPDVFDAESFKYSGKDWKPVTEFRKIKTGDNFGEMKIESAQSVMYKGDDMPYLMSMKMKLEGEHEFTGYFQYIAGDDYGVSAGDIRFYPDGSFKGYPIPATGHNELSLLFLPTYDSPEITVTAELKNGFNVGNIISGDSGAFISKREHKKLDPKVLDDIKGIIGSAQENIYTRVKIKLSDVSIEWSDQFGMGRTNADIVSIEEIE